MKIGSYFRVASNTTLNIILYAATTGEYLWLEGRVRRGVFRNWARRFKYAPIAYAEPSSEEEILRIVRSSGKGASVRLGSLLQRRKCQRPGPHIHG